MAQLSQGQEGTWGASRYLYADEMTVLLDGALPRLAQALSPNGGDEDDAGGSSGGMKLYTAQAALAADFCELARPSLRPAMTASLQVHAAGAYLEGGLKAPMRECLAM
eukprot:14685225-Alexandrium_andersonii.AAC.1